MNPAVHLYQLQQKDTRTSWIETRILEINSELGNDIALSVARQLENEARSELHKARHGLKIIEDEIQSIRIKIQTSEASLYGGRIYNPKELQDLQKEIISLKNRISHLEDLQLEAMFNVEEMETAHQSAIQKSQTAEASSIQNQASLHGELSSLEHELKKLAVERTAILQQVPQVQIDLYNQIRKQRRGIAVVQVQENACPGCGSTLRPAEIQSAKTSQDLTFCATCGRIIFAG